MIISTMIYPLITIFLLLLISVQLLKSAVILDGIALCQSNCGNTTARLVGPTLPPNPKQHPYISSTSIRPSIKPLKSTESCKLGCQLFFTELPYTVTCKSNCEWFYRYDSTIGYSYYAIQEKLECFDGCEIGYDVCEEGYYCSNQRLIPCPAGLTYKCVHISTCI